MEKIKSFVLLIYCIMLVNTISAQNHVKFDTQNWILANNARIENFMGREVLRGTAYLKDVQIENGILEVDIYSTGVRNFGGFMFNLQSFDDYEWCWLRMHKTNGFIQDGVQYAPIFNGTSCWQLNGGRNGIAPVNLPKNEWVHLKLVIQNDEAILFVADMNKPVLIMNNLQHDQKSGLVGLKGLWHDGLYFSNFSYQFTESIDDLDQNIEMKYEKDVISDWKLSPRYRINKFSETESYPTKRILDTKKWLTPKVGLDGLVNITRYYGHKPGEKKSCAMLKTIIKSKSERKVELLFGYSDAVTIFINGQPIFSGNRAYRSRNLTFGGWISFNDKVYLDLKKGDNELLVVIAEHFGGWGFQGKINMN